MYSKSIESVIIILQFPFTMNLSWSLNFFFFTFLFNIYNYISKTYSKLKLSPSENDLKFRAWDSELSRLVGIVRPLLSMFIFPMSWYNKCILLIVPKQKTCFSCIIVDYYSLDRACVTRVLSSINMYLYFQPHE